MKQATRIVLAALVTTTVYAEEFSNTPASEINTIVANDAILMSGLVRGASCAGVGLFLTGLSLFDSENHYFQGSDSDIFP